MSPTNFFGRMVVFFCFAAGAALAGEARAADSAKPYRLTDHGAVGDDKTLNTKAIQAAIDRCAAEGGGTIVVPQGTFLTGAIFLKQGVNLRIEKDGVLKGSANQADYPEVPTRWEGIERAWTAALVNAVDVTSVSLTGTGTIDGSADQWMSRPRGGARTGNALTSISQQYGAGPGRPRLVCFQNCRQVHVAGLKMRRQAIWCLHLLYSQDVLVEDLVIRAELATPSSDGIDVDSCKNVRITRVDIEANDDCISLKSGKDEDGRRVARPCENVIVENSRLGYGHGGVAMGSETSGIIRNVEVRNCVVEGGNWAPIRFKSQPSRGGVVENVVYRDMQLKNTRQAFEFNMEWRMVPPIAPPAKVLPVVRNVQCINITGTVSSGGLIHGLPSSPIQSVKFVDCNLTATTGLRLDYIKDLDTAGLKLKVAQGQPITVRQNRPQATPAASGAATRNAAKSKGQ